MNDEYPIGTIITCKSNVINEKWIKCDGNILKNDNNKFDELIRLGIGISYSKTEYQTPNYNNMLLIPNYKIDCESAASFDKEIHHINKYSGHFHNFYMSKENSYSYLNKSIFYNKPYLINIMDKLKFVCEDQIIIHWIVKYK